MRLAAALLAGLAAALMLPARQRLAPTASVGRQAVSLALVAVLGGGLAAVVLHGHQLVLVLIGLAAALAARRLMIRQRAARACETAAGRVQDFCEAIAAELTVGQPPQRVLTRSVHEFPEFAAVATAARLGADVPTSMRRLSEQPGCGELRLVAAAWQVAHRSGAGLAVALERVGGTIRERRRTARVVAAELAAAHATARMMAVLPLVFLLAGSGLGSDPVGFLTGTVAGLTCLALGLALSYLGLSWLQGIARAVVDP